MCIKCFFSFVGYVLFCLFLGNSSVWPKEQGNDPKQEKGSESGKEHHESPKKEEPVKVLAVPPLVIPVFEHNKICHYFSLFFRIEFKDSKDSLDAKPKLPKLIDQLFTHFYRLFSFLKYQNKLLSIEEVKEHIKGICTDFLGETIVQDIYVEGYALHQINREYL